MTSRQLLDQAILASHRTLLSHALFVGDDDGLTDEEHEAQAIEVARLSAMYGMQLMFRWQTCMSVADKMDRQGSDVPSTKPVPTGS
jgi:hypothetical protein